VQFEIPDSITVRNGKSQLLLSEKSMPAVGFTAVRSPADATGRRPLSVQTMSGWDGTFTRFEICPTTYPTCEVGMVLPLCGGVGRVESVSDENIKFKMLKGAGTPADITSALNDFPLILGIPTNDLRVDRIGTDEDGQLSADLTQTRDAPGDGPKQKIVREQFTRLTLDRTFVLQDDDTVTEYLITELVPPDAEQKIVGWIKLRPIEGSVREREPDEQP
jgi:hypothetical protein